MKKILLSLVVFACACGFAQAANYYVRGHGYWDTASSGTSDIFSLTNGGDPTGVNPMDGGATANSVQITVPRSMTVSGAGLRVNNIVIVAGGTAGTTYVTFSSGSSLACRDIIVNPTSGRSTTYSLLASGGSVLTITHSLNLGGTNSYASYAGVGTFVQDGASVTVNANVAEGGIWLSSPNSAAPVGGTYELRNGALHIRNVGAVTDAGLRAGKGNGTFLWTGGLLDICATEVSLENNGTGNLSVGGTGMVGRMTASLSGLIYTQGVDANYTVDIASASSYDVVDWSSGAATFADGARITVNLLDNPSLTVGQTFDIMIAQSITASTFSMAGEYASLFSAAVVDGNTLQLTYIPEPATAVALLGLLALAFATRRRK